MSIPKNTAYLLVFPLYDSTTGLLKTGATVTASTSSIDGGAFGATSNSVTEISGGYYSLQLTAGEMNGQVIAVKVTATGALAMTAQITTDDVRAAITSVQADTDDIQTRIPAALVGGRMDSSIGAVAAGAIAAASFAADAFDAIFTRALSAVEGAASSRSLAWAIAKLTNKVSLSGSTLSIKQTDDTTDMFTQSVTTDSNQAPVVGVDTA